MTARLPACALHARPQTSTNSLRVHWSCMQDVWTPYCEPPGSTRRMVVNGGPVYDVVYLSVRDDKGAQLELAKMP